MKKIISILLCAAMVFLVGCGNNSGGNGNSVKTGSSKLEDVIIGTWNVPWTDYDVTFRSDGSVGDSSNYHYKRYEIDGNMLHLYPHTDYDDGRHGYEVEIVSNDNLKLFKQLNDDTISDNADYMDRIS